MNCKLLYVVLLLSILFYVPVLNKAIVDYASGGETKVIEGKIEEYNIFTDEQVKHLKNGDKAHDRCIRKLKDVTWYRKEKNNVIYHLNMDNLKKYCFRYNCEKAYNNDLSCSSRKEYWNTCKKNIINEALNPWIKGTWTTDIKNNC